MFPFVVAMGPEKDEEESGRIGEPLNLPIGDEFRFDRSYARHVLSPLLPSWMCFVMRRRIRLTPLISMLSFETRNPITGPRFDLSS
jgi:hypothetical protein